MILYSLLGRWFFCLGILASSIVIAPSSAHAEDTCAAFNSTEDALFVTGLLSSLAAGNAYVLSSEDRSWWGRLGLGVPAIYFGGLSSLYLTLTVVNQIGEDDRDCPKNALDFLALGAAGAALGFGLNNLFSSIDDPT